MKMLCFLPLAVLCTSCSTAQIYDFIAVNTGPDCDKYLNPEERKRCRKEAEMSYEEYEKERRKAKGNQ